MRFESSVTSISWIPSEAIEGMPEIPFELGIGHYDQPPPDRLEEAISSGCTPPTASARLITSSAWIEVENGGSSTTAKRVAAGRDSTRFSLGPVG